MTAALAKARSLIAFAKDQGAPLETYELTISDAEAFELLDWFVGQYGEDTLLGDDVALAKMAGDPWTVLCHFTLLGLRMAPIPVIH
jgi:hypothetical protein